MLTQKSCQPAVKTNMLVGVWGRGSAHAFFVVEDTAESPTPFIERLGRGGHCCDRAPSLEDARHFAATSAMIW